MARIIEFQIPKHYRPKAQAVISITRGKVIQFPAVSEKPERPTGRGGPGIARTVG